jgi:pentatricopeptide repeat protein
VSSKNYTTDTKIYQDIPYERKLRSLEERRRKDEIDVYLKIRSLIQKKKLDEALAEFEEFKQKNEQCTEIFYTKILTAFSRGGSVEGVEKVFTKFMQDKYKPKQEHYDRIIRVYCANQKVEKALQLAKHMVDAGSQLSSETFGWVIELCEKTGNKESADNIFKLFRESGLPPSESLLRTVLHQRSEAEFEFKVPARSKSHFQYLKHEQRNGTKNGFGSEAMPNVNIDSSLKKQTSSVNINSNSNRVNNMQNDSTINSNNSTQSLKPNTNTNTATSSTVIPK